MTMGVDKGSFFQGSFPWTLLLAALFCGPGLLCAQTSALQKLTFTLDFPGSDPAHYTLTVTSDGRGSYESDGKLLLQAQPGDRSGINFTLSAATRDQIFNLARQIRSSDQRKENHKVASTGTKTFSFDNGQSVFKITYDYSPVAKVRDLTSLFQRLSCTLEFGRRLQYEHRYQKLALAEDMKYMDGQFHQGMLLDVGTIGPVLQKIVDDPSVINGARMRAQQLLLADTSSPSGSQKSE